MWLEQKTEGSRLQRIKLDQEPWSFRKLGKKGMKHLSWFYVAYATGFTFVGYFYPVRELVVDFWSFNLAIMPLSWIVFFTLATYINAGWMREQVCMYMCPYARFQSVMFDHDTLIVSYDAGRGEPRGSRKRSADASAQGLGDCVSCELCKQVCPTGIDIRDGLQYQCIGCALCIDACDSVMDKMEYPRGLIRYSSENALASNKTHWLRPRIIGYTLVLTLMVTVFSLQVFGRIPIEMTALRDRNQLYVTTTDGAVENLYTLQLANKDESMHEFVISISQLNDARIIGETSHTLAAGEIKSINLRIRAQPNALTQGNTEFVFHAKVPGSDTLQVEAESRFLKPL
jgi:cytochrome c oxidase accessory protein FixG